MKFLLPTLNVLKNKNFKINRASVNYAESNHIGILYYLGDGDSSFKGFKVNAKKSLEWFKLAINNGSKSAETNAEIVQSYLYGRDDKRVAELILD